MNIKQIEKLSNSFNKELQTLKKLADTYKQQEGIINNEMQKLCPNFDINLQQLQTILSNLAQIPAPSPLVSYVIRQIEKLINEYKDLMKWIRTPQEPRFRFNKSKIGGGDTDNNNVLSKSFPKGKPH